MNGQLILLFKYYHAFACIVYKFRRSYESIGVYRNKAPAAGTVEWITAVKLYISLFFDLVSAYDHILCAGTETVVIAVIEIRYAVIVTHRKEDTSAFVNA